MRSTFTGIEIAKRSLFAQQIGLSTTAHNMANTNTPGYSRQMINLVAAKPMEAVGMMRTTIPGQNGMGVEFDSVVRIREKFLDTQYYNEQQNLGDWKIRKDTLQKLESIMSEPSETGLRTVMSDFFNSWQELSKEPDSRTARAVIKETMVALTDSFNQMSRQFSELKRDLTSTIEVKANQMNTLLDQVAGLNENIHRLEGLGNNANDLRDQRDLLMDELSQIVNVQYTDTPSGYTVTMGGTTLVEGFDANSGWDEASLTAAYGGGSGDLQGGQIKGMIVSRDEYVSEYEREFNNMIYSLAEGDMNVTLPAGAVIPDGTILNGVTYSGSISNRTLAADTQVTVKGLNGLHTLGYAMTTGSVQQAVPLFVAKDGSGVITASNVTINPAIDNNVEMIASSMRTTDASGTETLVVGNNNMALLIASVNRTSIQFGTGVPGSAVVGSGSVDEYLRVLIGQIGVQSDESNRRTHNSQILVEQIDGRRQSVSGVSLDEEVSNMIKYQHAYNAAARAMTTFDEALDRVINNMGLVGR